MAFCILHSMGTKHSLKLNGTHKECFEDWFACVRSWSSQFPCKLVLQNYNLPPRPKLTDTLQWPNLLGQLWYSAAISKPWATILWLVVLLVTRGEVPTLSTYDKATNNLTRIWYLYHFRPGVLWALKKGLGHWDEPQPAYLTKDYLDFFFATTATSFDKLTKSSYIVNAWVTIVNWQALSKRPSHKTIFVSLI